MEKQKNTPELRFPGFDGEWVEKRLEELFSEFKSGYGITSKKIDERGTYPVYGGNGLRGFTNSFTHDGFYLLIGRQGALCGNVNRSYGKAYISEHAIACIANETSDTEWLAQRLEFYNLNRLSESSAQPGLSVNKLLRFKLIVPRQPEQQKIASFFTAIDKKISQLKQKKTLLEQYKKGVMQKIFSQEIRFRDENGQKFSKWEKKRLGEIGSVKMCKRIFADQTDENGEVPFYKIGTLGNSPDAFISKELFNTYKSKYNYPQKGQTLITCSGTIGKCVQFDGIDSYYQDSNIVWIDNTDKSVSDDFLFLLLSNYKWDKLNSTTITRIYTSDLRILQFRFPTIKEQTKIANFLSAIDTKINHTQTQIENAERWKKGLLQKMFV